MFVIAKMFPSAGRKCHSGLITRAFCLRDNRLTTVSGGADSVAVANGSD